jgi:hypothetical protein
MRRVAFTAVDSAVLRRVLAGAVVIAAGLAPQAAAAQDRVVRTISESFEPAGATAVRLELSAGEVRVKGAAVETISVEVRVDCPRGRDLDRCRDNAEDVSVTTAVRRGTLVIYAEGPGFWRARDAHLDIELTLPRALAFRLELTAGDVEISEVGGGVIVDLGAGELRLTDIGGDIIVDMGAGEVMLTTSEDTIRSVTLDNGIGESVLHHRNGARSREGVMPGTDVRWNDGPGTHRIEIDLNVGEINVRLR